MKAVDKLEKLIWERWGKTDEWSIEYHARNETMSTGYCYRGYYLVCRTPEYWARPRTQKSWDWEEYVNGRFIGSSYEEARAEIIERIPDLPVKRTQEVANQEMADASEAADDYRRWQREQYEREDAAPLSRERTGDE